jgi:hypothetical protein
VAAFHRRMRAGCTPTATQSLAALTQVHVPAAVVQQMQAAEGGGCTVVCIAIDGRLVGSSAVASFLAAVLAEIYLCASCSCHEILRSATARGPRWARQP